jgi:hypothetical protein
MTEIAAGKLSLAEIALNARFSSQASFTRLSSRDRCDARRILTTSTLIRVLPGNSEPQEAIDGAPLVSKNDQKN